MPGLPVFVCRRRKKKRADVGKDSKKKGGKNVRPDSPSFLAATLRAARGGEGKEGPALRERVGRKGKGKNGTPLWPAVTISERGTGRTGCLVERKKKGKGERKGEAVLPILLIGGKRKKGKGAPCDHGSTRDVNPVSCRLVPGREEEKEKGGGKRHVGCRVTWRPA